MDVPLTPAGDWTVPRSQPESQRHADIIERTAHFVARQGPQMEILIKAKQADNAMFNFLSFDDPLQPFFRHMVVMIKAGRYTIGPQKTGQRLTAQPTVSRAESTFVAWKGGEGCSVSVCHGYFIGLTVHMLCSMLR